MGRRSEVAQFSDEKSECFTVISGKLTCANFWRGIYKKLSNGCNASMDSSHRYIGVDLFAGHGQYSLGNNRVVALRSASVMIQTNSPAMV